MPFDVDIRELTLAKQSPRVLEMLLTNKTTGGHLRWATDTYAQYGEGYHPADEITTPRMLVHEGRVVTPRVSKAQDEQERRTKDKGEVFTPRQVCKSQNDLVDAAWFGIDPEGLYRNGAFAPPLDDGRRSWRRYVDKKVLEPACGEAPYLADRYDVLTGEEIPLPDRAGLLDRKLDMVDVHARTDDEWMKWAIRALEASYAYDIQGDNVLLARENVLVSYLDHYEARFSKKANLRILLKAAGRIAWNVFQMDGRTFDVPYESVVDEDSVLFGEPVRKPVPSLIRDWRDCKGGTARPFRELIKAR